MTQKEAQQRTSAALPCYVDQFGQTGTLCGFAELPARNGQVVEVDVHLTSADAIDLEVGDQSWSPSERECRRGGSVDAGGYAVESRRLIGDNAGAVAGIGDLNVVPGVDAPIARVALGCRMEPMVLWLARSSEIAGVVPRTAPAVALEAVDHSIAIRLHLVHIHLDIGESVAGTVDVDPTVI